jgi:hypothetical protein
MVTGEEMQPVRKDVLCTMGETVNGFAGDNARVQKMRKIPIESNLSEADHHANTWKSFDLL